MGVLILLDTSALLTLRDDEPGADRVEQVLSDSQSCYACFLSSLEVLYRVWKDEGEAAGRLAYEHSEPCPCSGWRPPSRCWLPLDASRPAIHFPLPMPGLLLRRNRWGHSFCTRIRSSVG